MKNKKSIVCYLSASAGDWGGASRVLFTNLRLLDRQQFEPLVLLPNEGPVIPYLQQLNIKYVLWGVAHEPGGWGKYLKDIVSAYRLFRHYKVDILHINHCNYWRPAEIIAALLLRIPIITHYHVVIQKPEPAPFVKYSDLIIANSSYTAAVSETDGVPVEVVHNVVDFDRFDAAKDIRDELGIKRNKIVVSFIGQIRTIKGIDLFINLAKKINNEQVIFLIAGACRDPEKIGDTYTQESLDTAIRGEPNINYIGYQSDVENIYKSSDIIIMPSRWDEPFGLINIEAGAAYKPVVATKVGGIPEIINHADNGFLVNRDDLESLVYYTKKLIEDENLRHAMGNRARQVVKEKFTHKPIRKLEEIYHSLLSNK